MAEADRDAPKVNPLPGEPLGVAKRRVALGHEGFTRGEGVSAPLPRTDSLGRFMTANQNPQPVPREYVGGADGEADGKTGR